MNKMRENMGSGNRGRGRPKGARNKKTQELASIIDGVIPIEERVRLVAELARGILVEQTEAHGKQRVYARPPDLAALRWLEEYRTGKPIQHVVDLQNEQGSKPQLIIYLPEKDNDHPTTNYRELPENDGNIGLRSK
jgi:hypothetical protein